MSFGKPRLGSERVRCLECGEEYPEHDIQLKHAGRTVEGDYWNSKCPHCGSYNSMGEEYAELTEEEFQEEKERVKKLREDAQNR